MSRLLPTIALVGDYSPKVVAHRAIGRALELARADTGIDFGWRWIATRELRDAPRDLAGFAAVWLAPASPYENPAGALAAVRFVRESGRPFLGTCGGFQHALLEVARDVAGLADADSTETNPDGRTPVINQLSCSLVDKTDRLHFAPGSRVRAIYGRDTAVEGYRCNYGLNAKYRAALESAGWRFTALDEANEVRAGELPESMHPFFVGTLFQLERAALRDETPPVAAAFVRAAAEFSP